MTDNRQIPLILQHHAPKVIAFLLEINDVCRKHGLSLSHEDSFGAFVVENYNTRKRDWLWRASNKIKHPIQPTRVLVDSSADDQYKVALTVDCPFCAMKVGIKCSGIVFPQYPHTARLAKAVGMTEGEWLQNSSTLEVRDVNNKQS
jgi:hypothetical protein